MTEDRVHLGACDLLRFLGYQLSGLEQDLRRIEGAILAAARESSSERRVIQGFDRSLQTVQDLANLCAGGSDDLEGRRAEAEYLSRHLRLGSLKLQLVHPERDGAEDASEIDFFD